MLKSAAIFHGLLNLCADSGRIFLFRFFISVTPANTTERKVLNSVSCLASRNNNLSCARKSKNTWLFAAESTSSIIITIGLSEILHQSVNISKSSSNAACDSFRAIISVIASNIDLGIFVFPALLLSFLQKAFTNFSSVSKLALPIP